MVYHGEVVVPEHHFGLFSASSKLTGNVDTVTNADMLVLGSKDDRSWFLNCQPKLPIPDSSGCGSLTLIFSLVLMQDSTNLKTPHRGGMKNRVAKIGTEYIVACADDQEVRQPNP